MSGRRTTAALAAAGVFALAPVGGVVALAAVTPLPAASGSSCAVAGTGAVLIAGAARAAGFPADQQVMAVAIAVAESNGVPDATNVNQNGSTDFGLWQINSIHTDVLATGDWKEPVANGRMALTVWQQAGGSWTPWSTYDNGAYLAYVDEATGAVSGAPAPTCTAGVGAPAGASAAAATIIAAARTMLGVPYTWGGESEVTGFDCSGYTQWAYAQAGVGIPRNSAAQAAFVRPTTTPRPGDLVFYGNPVHHVALYLGEGRQLAAPHRGTVIQEQAVYGGAFYGAVLP